MYSARRLRPPALTTRWDISDTICAKCVFPTPEMHRVLSAQLDNPQKQYGLDVVDGLYDNQEIDLRSLMKSTLVDYRAEPSVIDDMPNTSVHRMMRPLQVRETGCRTNLAPYVPDVFIGDRTPDCRGTENIPNQRLAYQMTLDKSKWIKNNLYKDTDLQVVSEQIPHMKVVENKQKTDARMKEYLKVFSNEQIGGMNQKFIQHKSKSAVSNVEQDQVLESERRNRVMLEQATIPRAIRNYNKVVSEGNLEMLPRSEPDHLQQVGSSEQIIYSNPVYDPVARRLGAAEQFSNARDTANETLNKNQQHKTVASRYKQLQYKIRDPRASSQDRDTAREQFLEEIKQMPKLPTKQKLVEYRDQSEDRDKSSSMLETIRGFFKLPNKQKVVDYREQAQDRDQSAQDALEYIITAPQSRKYKIGKNNPLHTGISDQQLDHFREQFNHLQDQDKKLVAQAIRKAARRGVEPIIRLTMAEEITELASKGQQGRRQLQVLADPTSNEYDFNLALDTITERLTTKYRNALPPTKAEARIKLLQFEVQEAKNENMLKRSRNGAHQGNNSKTAQKVLNYTQPQDHDVADHKQSTKLSSRHMDLQEKQNSAANLRSHGSQQQIEHTQGLGSMRVNTAVYDMHNANRLKYAGNIRDSQLGEKLIGK